MKNAFQKNICKVLIFGLLSSIALPAWAIDNSIDASIQESNLVAYLENENGEKIPIDCKVITNKSRIKNNEESVTCEFAVPRAAILHEQETGTAIDKSYSVRGYVTIDFLTKNTPTEYLLTDVSGNWIILDSHVTVTDAMVAYECFDLNPGSIQQSDSRIVANNFSFPTGYTTYVVAPYGTMGATITLTLTTNGSHTWKLQVPYYQIEGEPIWG